jgi:hypothetical protein
MADRILSKLQKPRKKTTATEGCLPLTSRKFRCAPVPPKVEQPIDKPSEEDQDRLVARGIYTLAVGALAIALKDEALGAAERRKMIALAADAYFPLTDLEKLPWTFDATEDPSSIADESRLD